MLSLPSVDEETGSQRLNHQAGPFQNSIRDARLCSEPKLLSAQPCRLPLTQAYINTKLQGILRPSEKTIGRDLKSSVLGMALEVKCEVHTGLARRTRDMGRVMCLRAVTSCGGGESH